VFALLGSVLNHALMCDFRLRQFVSEFFYAYVALFERFGPLYALHYLD